MSGLVAMALLALAGLLPIIGQMRVDYRTWSARPRGMTTAQAHAAVLAHLDELAAATRRVKGAMHANGVLPDRRRAPRAGGAA